MKMPQTLKTTPMEDVPKNDDNFRNKEDLRIKDHLGNKCNEKMKITLE